MPLCLVRIDKPAVKQAWYPGRLDCIALAGDVVTGTLLAQIVYWHLPNSAGQSKGGVLCSKDGLRYIAKTREEWMAETGLTLKQYKRAIFILKAKGLVEVRRMQFQRLTQSHTRLCLDRIRSVELPDDGAKGTGTMDPKGPKQWSLKDRTRVQRIQTEITPESNTPVLGNVDQDQRSTETLSTTGEEPEGRVKEVEEVRRKEEDIAATMTQSDTKRWRMKASDVLKAHHGPTEGSLGAFWKSRCTLVLGSFQRALTGKECGQLKQLHKYLGPDTRPVIDYAINHWWKFASRAGASAGVTFPAEPHIGFLLKYHGVAMNLLRPEAQTPSPPVVEAPVQLIANTDTEPVHELTSQELTELLDGLKSP